MWTRQDTRPGGRGTRSVRRSRPKSMIHESGENCERKTKSSAWLIHGIHRGRRLPVHSRKHEWTMDNEVDETRPMKAEEVAALAENEFHYGNETTSGDPNEDARQSRGEERGTVANVGEPTVLSGLRGVETGNTKRIVSVPNAASMCRRCINRNDSDNVEMTAQRQAGNRE